MSGLKKLIHEAHRRSIWQVLGIYLFSSWIVIQVVEVLTESAGLPDWTPGFALVLVLMGLPICLATAVVQEGLPGGDDPAPGTGSADASVETEPPASVPQTAETSVGAVTVTPSPPASPSGVRRFLTWRNAILGGVGAFALLGVSVFAYFISWSTGVGPVGSLVAQGVLDERDPVVLADFQNNTRQDGLGDVVTEALRVDLLESPVLTLLAPSQVGDVLRLMGRSPNEALTPDLAQEIAVREGIKAIIEGDVASVGSAYVISASIVAGGSGEILKAFRETARSDDDVVDAIDRVSQSIREGAGESLRTIRAGEPLERATTASLAALQKLTAAERAEELGDYSAAIALLEEAVDLDPEFAMAYRKIAVLHFNQGTNTRRAREATELAYRHRDRLTERERYLAEAYYHSQITRDEPAKMLAYRNALRVAPDESAALNNLALSHLNRGELEEALPLLERAVGGPGESSVANGNLVRVRVGLGDLAGARAAWTRYQARYPGHVFLTWSAAKLALAEADPEAVHQAARELMEDERAPDLLRTKGPAYAAVYDATRGKLEEARDHYIDAATLAARLELPGEALEQALRVHGVDRALLPGGARAEDVEATLAQWSFEHIPANRRPWVSAIRELSAASRPEQARRLLVEWETLVTSNVEDPSLFENRQVAQSFILAGEADPDAGLERLVELQRDRDCDRCGLHWIAPMLEQAGRDDEAAAAWETLLTVSLDDSFDDWWPFHRIQALVHLGPLYERLGDTSKAADAYQALADAWTEADPELQPTVEEARAKAAVLRGGDGP